MRWAEGTTGFFEQHSCQSVTLPCRQRFDFERSPTTTTASPAGFCVLAYQIALDAGKNVNQKQITDVQDTLVAYLRAIGADDKTMIALIYRMFLPIISKLP